VTGKEAALDGKAPDAFRTISEVAGELDLPQHVLRFWETRFRDIKPMKRGGGRRYYRPDDVDLLRGIRHLLYGEGYTIRGVQRILREQGIKFVQAVWQEGAPQPPHASREEESYAEEAASATAMLEEEGGLAGQLGSLIGRDLTEGSASPHRQEPPLKSAPVPHVGPDDRVIHGGGEAAPAEQSHPIQAALARSAAPVSRGHLGRNDLQRLHAVLHELKECRRLIDAGLAHTD
jgi:DNA-binding transcriptional MerR regulator